MSFHIPFASTTPCREKKIRSKPRSLLKSGLGALFGIQSSLQREQDFNTGKPADFILIGLVIVAALLLIMIFLVNSIIP